MGDRQKRLIETIQDAMFARGITGGQMAAAIGTSHGYWSQAMNGKTNMQEEKWRIACEKLEMDYDKLIMDEVKPEPDSEQRKMANRSELEHDVAVLACYAKECLEKEFRAGVTMTPGRLYDLMRAVERNGVGWDD